MQKKDTTYTGSGTQDRQFRNHFVSPTGPNKLMEKNPSPGFQPTTCGFRTLSSYSVGHGDTKCGPGKLSKNGTIRSQVRCRIKKTNVGIFSSQSTN